MNTILADIEGTVTFAFLLFTLISACPEDQVRLRQRRHLFFLAAIWCAVFFFTEKTAAAAGIDGQTVYSVIVLLLALTFTLLFQRGSFPSRLSVIVTYLYSIICVKVSFLNILGTYGFGMSGILSQTIRNYAIYYAILAGLAVFIVKHTIIGGNELPRRYWVIMILCPALLLAYILLLVSYQFDLQSFNDILTAS